MTQAAMEAATDTAMAAVMDATFISLVGHPATRIVRPKDSPQDGAEQTNTDPKVIAFGVGVNAVLRAHAPETLTTIAFNALCGFVLPLAISDLVRHPTTKYKLLL